MYTDIRTCLHPHVLKTDRASFLLTLYHFRMQIKLDSVDKRPKADAHKDNTGF